MASNKATWGKVCERGMWVVTPYSYSHRTFYLATAIRSHRIFSNYAVYFIVNYLIMSNFDVSLTHEKAVVT